MPDEVPKPEVLKSPIQKLKEGLLLKYHEKQMDEPGYYAIGTLSDEAQVLQNSNTKPPFRAALLVTA